MEFKLTQNQQELFDLIEHTNYNIAVQGKPGTGKSVLVRALISKGLKNYMVAAPTGLAAINIKGRTLHSIFRLPASQGVIAPDFNLFNQDEKVMNFIKFGIKHLIIDEMSMVRADMFDYIDRYCQFVRGNDEPFGGIQVILVGDFYQLPPVVVGPESVQLKEYGYVSNGITCPFLFASKCFSSFKMHYLTEVLRQQGDPGFVKILDKARTGELSPAQVDKLNKQVQREPEEFVISLCGSNAQADQINSINNGLLKTQECYYRADVFGDWSNTYPAPETLHVKIGSQVMVKQNGADKPPGATGKEVVSKVVNGTIGKVVELLPEAVIIELKEGEQVKIYRREFERKVKKRGDEGWEEVVVASFQQIPLQLAWAITIHKSQGQTFERVHIDASKIFAAGQLYVALSRCKTLKGITFKQRVVEQKFWPDKSVTKYFENL